MKPLFDYKQGTWIWHIALLSVVLGMLLAAALKTQQSVRLASGIPTQRVSGLTQLLLDEREQKKIMKAKIADLQLKVDKYEQAMGEGGIQSKVLNEELQKAKLLAGLLPVTGDGVQVTLRDSRKAMPTDLDPGLRPEWIIHDADLCLFVRELFANGAEAIAIGDKDGAQRLIVNTPIRCEAGVIKINRVAMSSPFVITAIGPPNPMKSALEMPGGLISQFRFVEGLTSTMVRVKTVGNIVIPAYSGSTSFFYAKTMEPGSKPK